MGQGAMGGLWADIKESQFLHTLKNGKMGAGGSKPLQKNQVFFTGDRRRWDSATYRLKWKRG